MAREATNDNVEVPKFVVSAGYTVNRLGEFPAATVMLAECVYVQDNYTLDAVAGRVLSIGALADNEQLVGHVVALPDSTTIGTVQMSEKVLVSSDPDVYTRELTLAADPLEALTAGQTVGVVRTTPVGAPAYKQSVTGRSWQLTVSAVSSDGLTRLLTMMGNIGFGMLKAGLGAVNVSKTDEEIGAAVQALAAQGINIDSFFGDQGDALEIDRLAGAIPWVLVTGPAPVAE